MWSLPSRLLRIDSMNSQPSRPTRPHSRVVVVVGGGVSQWLLRCNTYSEECSSYRPCVNGDLISLLFKNPVRHFPRSHTHGHAIIQLIYLLTSTAGLDKLRAALPLDGRSLDAKTMTWPVHTAYNQTWPRWLKIPHNARVLVQILAFRLYCYLPVDVVELWAIASLSLWTEESLPHAQTYNYL